MNIYVNKVNNPIVDTEQNNAYFRFTKLEISLEHGKKKTDKVTHTTKYCKPVSLGFDSVWITRR